MKNSVYYLLFVFSALMFFVIILVFNPIEQEKIEVELIKPLWKHEKIYIKEVAITSNGDYFMTVGGVFRIFNKDGNIILKDETMGRDHVKISEDGEFILTDSWKEGNSWGGFIVLLDKNGKELWRRETGQVNAFAMTLHAEYIAVGAFDKQSIEYYTSKSHIYLFDKKGNMLWNYKTKEPIWEISISSDGEFICVSTRKNNLYVFNNKGDILWSRKEVTIGKISKDGKFVVYGTNEEQKRLVLSNIEGKEIWSAPIDAYPTALQMTYDLSSIIIATTESIYYFNRIDNTDWHYSRMNNIFSIILSGDGNYIVIGSLERMSNTYITVFNKDGNILWKYDVGDTVFSISMSKDNKYIGVGCRSSKIFFFDNFRAIEEYKKRPPETTIPPYIIGIGET